MEPWTPPQERVPVHRDFLVALGVAAGCLVAVVVLAVLFT